jgi:cardiolipin synthase (CMP-forming)
MGGRFWTVSNVLSFSRVILVLPIAVLLFHDDAQSRAWSVVLIAVAIATDFLDGFFARRLHQVSDWGKVIDPVADKIAAAVLVVVLVITGTLPVWYAVLVLVRDLLLLAGAIVIQKRKKIVPQSNWPGKVAVSAIAVVVLLAVLNMPELETLKAVAIWGSVALMVFSVASYAGRLSIGIRAKNS